jgi:phosphatidylglycerol:prolipoprotein diacylglycerol transferase
MHRELLDLGFFTLYSYGFLLACAFFLANQFARRSARQFGYDPDKVEETVMYCILLGVLGSRLGYVVQYPGQYLAEPWQILNLRQGGLTVMGGFLFTIAFQCHLCWRQGKSVLNLFDFLAGPLLVGMAFGRLGCFSHGCCYGEVCHLPWAITYPEGIIPGGPAGPRHPSQLYEMGADLMLLGLIAYQLPRLRYAGQNFYTFMLGYGLIRFADEFTRYNDAYFGGLSVYQWTSLGMALVGLLGLAGLFGKPAVDREIFPRPSRGADKGADAIAPTADKTQSETPHPAADQADS